MISRAMSHISRTVHVTRVFQDRLEMAWSMHATGVVTADEVEHTIRIHVSGRRAELLRSIVYDVLQHLLRQRYPTLVDGTTVRIRCLCGGETIKVSRLRMMLEESGGVSARFCATCGALSRRTLLGGLSGLSSAAAEPLGAELDEDVAALASGNSAHDFAGASTELQLKVINWASLRLQDTQPQLWVPIQTVLATPSAIASADMDTLRTTLANTSSWTSTTFTLQPVCCYVDPAAPMHVVVKNNCTAAHMSMEKLVKGSSYFVRLLRVLAVLEGVEVRVEAQGRAVDVGLIPAVVLQVVADGVENIASGAASEVVLSGVDTPIEDRRGISHSLGWPLGVAHAVAGETHRSWACASHEHSASMRQSEARLALVEQMVSVHPCAICHATMCSYGCWTHC